MIPLKDYDMKSTRFCPDASLSHRVKSKNSFGIGNEVTYDAAILT